MKNFFLFFWLFSLGALFSQSDCQDGRYESRIFSNVQLNSAIPYGSNVNPPVAPTTAQTLSLDLYQPENDTLAARPLIIWSFGGAFIFGSRNSPDIEAFSRSFAERGYVCAAIDYRLSTNLFLGATEATYFQAVYKAQQDVKAAVRFFYRDAATANQYRIDTNRIYLAGVSAGAFASLHAAYLDPDEVPPTLADDTTMLGGIQGESGNPGYSSRVAGVINLCGAMGAVQWLEAGDIPVVSSHGTADAVVPYDTGNITLFNLSFPVAGSAVIHRRADSIGVTNQLQTFVGAAHTPFVQLTPPFGLVQAYFDSTESFVADFLADLVCSPAVSRQPEIAFDLDIRRDPVQKHLYLTSDRNLSRRPLVFDLRGRSLQPSIQRVGDSWVIDYSSVAPGVYVLRIVDERENILAIRKITLL